MPISSPPNSTLRDSAAGSPSSRRHLRRTSLPTVSGRSAMASSEDHLYGRQGRRRQFIVDAHGLLLVSPASRLHTLTDSPSLRGTERREGAPHQRQQIEELAFGELFNPGFQQPAQIMVVDEEQGTVGEEPVYPRSPGSGVRPQRQGSVQPHGHIVQSLRVVQVSHHPPDQLSVDIAPIDGRGKRVVP